MPNSSADRPLLVATDLDGTFLRTDGTVSPRSRRALALVERAGCQVVFATGRPPSWLHTVADEAGHRGFAICANGALVYDLHDERIVERFPISTDLGAEALRLITESIDDVVFAVQRESGLFIQEGYRSPSLYGEANPLSLDEMWTEPAIKLLVRHGTWSADDLLARTRDVVGELVEVTHSNGTRLVEISAPGVSKASTLSMFCAERGIPAEHVVAFGDMPNDLPMLAWAGTAYAVAGAHPDVLAATPSHCPASDEDGVAQVLEKLFG